MEGKPSLKLLKLTLFIYNSKEKTKQATEQALVSPLLYSFLRQE